MTIAALLHAATDIEKSITNGRKHRRRGERDSSYWAGADDAITGVLGILRGRADELAKASARIERLRTFASRATAGEWHVESSDGDDALYAGDTRLGRLAPHAATYLTLVQPKFVLALLSALDDPQTTAPDISGISAATHYAPRGPWTYTGAFLRSLDGEDLGWLLHSHDIDFAASASPAFIGGLVRTLRIVRGA